LRNRLLKAGFATTVAGPGWPRSAKPLRSLAEAVERLTLSR
jgi:hypothetical protein